MSKYIALFVILALRMIFHPSHAETPIAPFAKPSPRPVASVSFKPASVVSFQGTVMNNKVTLNWVVNENETADLFEIEKSIDGKTFTMAALVFGTDKPTTDNYQFYEKAGNQKVMYRIKLINKNKKAEYSTVVEISPTV